jgi:hypothetical protein
MGQRDYAGWMRAELKALDTPDSPDGSLSSFHPEDGEQFALLVSASVGPAGEDGGELFGFTVCSPTWVAAEELPKGFAFQRHTLLVERWNPEVVERAIADLCRRTEGETWTEVAQMLSRFGHWEFEDYRPGPHASSG